MKLSRRFYIAAACGVLLLVVAAAVIVWFAMSRKKPAVAGLYDTSVSSEVMALMQQYASAAGAARIENDGRYSSVQELLDRKMLNEDFAQVMGNHPNPKPVGGYLIVDMDQNKDGLPIDRRVHSGICLYSPTKEKNLLLVVMDANDFADAAMYEGLPGGPREPMRQWPTPKEMDDLFLRMERKVSSDLDDAMGISDGGAK